MIKESTSVVTVLGKTIKLHCDRKAEADLKSAATELNKRLKATKGGIQARDDVLAVTALNLMHELMSLQQQLQAHDDNVNEQINQMLERVESIEK